MFRSGSYRSAYNEGAFPRSMMAPKRVSVLTMTEDLGPTLLTERLRLRVPTGADTEFAQSMYSKPEVVRYIGAGEPELSMEEAAARIERYRARFGPLTGVWVVEGREDRVPRGFVLLKPIPFSSGATVEQEDIEIGWHLHPHAWGSGFAAEAAAALLAHAESQGLQRLVAVTHPDNDASKAVAVRLGMTAAGLTTRYYDTTCELFCLDL